MQMQGKNSKSKTAKPRATVGSNKKKISKKKLVLLVVPVVALLGLGGYFGVKQLQLRQLKAQAGGWTNVASDMLACRVTSNNEFGSFWKIKFFTVNETKVTKYFNFYVEKSNQIYSATHMQIKPGQWVYREAYAPRADGYTYSTGVNNGNGFFGGAFTQKKNINNIAYC